MRSTFDELVKEIGELRALIASIEPVNKALSGHKDPTVREYLTIRRRFDYASFVVALYSSFEKFSENLVISFARLVSKREKYASLPAAMTRKHMLKTAEILSRGRLGEGRYEKVQSFDMVRNLFDCLSGKQPYALNDTALIAHDMNLRYDELQKLFFDSGIQNICDRARQADAICAWFVELNALENSPQDGVPITLMRERLDDLVERRNQVAHRGGTPENLIGVDEMKQMICFFESFAKSIYALAVAEYLTIHHINNGDAKSINLREGPYKNGSVIVVEKPVWRLFVGQPIFILIDGPVIRYGRIISLELNNISVNEINENCNVDTVGIMVDFKCTKSSKLFTLQADDDAVWCPNAVSIA